MARVSRIAKQLTGNQGKAIDTGAPDLSQADRDRLSKGAGTSAAWNPGRVEFLTSLTEHQLAKFFSLSEAKQHQIVLPHMAGFQESLLELQGRELDGPLPKAASAIPETTEGLLAALPDSPPDWATRAAGALSLDFGSATDHLMWPEFHRVCAAVALKQFPAEHLLDAFRQAMNPKSKNRGAIFNTALKRHGWGK